MLKICYLNLTKDIPPRDAVYLRGLKENGMTVVDCRDHSPGIKKLWEIFKKYRAVRNSCDILWVGYTAHILVPLVRLISRKKIIFNALGSLYEGIIISRGQASPFSLKALYCWLTDWLAFHSASVSLVESNEQRKWLMKKFFLPARKLQRAWTGVDDAVFFYDPAIPKLPNFTVLFRGGFLPESGVEYAVKAARLLKNENVKFKIIGSGLMADKVKKTLQSFDSKNIEWFSEKLNQSQLRIKMQECHLSLGQLSAHDRLNRTIPHKAFESMIMKIPYLTARNKGILELLQENKTCFACRPADVQDLAAKILEIKNNPEQAGKIADNAFELYQKELTPKILAQEILSLF
ncbi:MAG: glycosyltransferase family 4 protein [Candidatus Nealsonbacteria bacterium]|nr:glycosyltransferase family 4 protein [Candidatus Nealsonbacteria bacterium]